MQEAESTKQPQKEISSKDLYEDIPNKQYLDWWLDQMEQRYDHERLEDMSLDRLHNMEFEVMAKFRIFKAGFPDKDSTIKGRVRAVALDKPNETRESLTPLEKTRLRQAQEDFKHEVYRAKELKLKERREHRSRILNSLCDFVDSFARVLKNLRP